jgi:hypothetical protein
MIYTPQNILDIAKAIVERIKDGEKIPKTDDGLRQIALYYLEHHGTYYLAQVPWTAGTDRTDSWTYIDPLVPEALRVKGIVVIVRVLLMLHEHAEVLLMHFGLDYNTAHEYATICEHLGLHELYPDVNAADYEAALAPIIQRARRDFDPENVPADLNPNQEPQDRYLITDAIRRYDLGERPNG